MRITSPDNPIVRRLRRYTESARACREAGRTIAEGMHVIDVALAAGVPILTLATRGTPSAEVAPLVDRALAGPAERGAKIIELAAPLYDAISPVEHGVGILAEVAIPAVDEAPAPNEDAIFLDGVQDPGNVGTLLRTAAAAGVRRVILGDGSAFAWSPKAMRAAMGAHFALRISECSLADVTKTFRGAVLAADVDGEELYAAEWGRGPTMWLFGSEGQGLGDEALAAADLRLRIPLAPGVESLNVAAAAAVCLFEQVRRRRRVG